MNVAALVQQVGQHRHAVVEGSPLQRVKALVVGPAQRLGLRLCQLAQLLKVAERGGLPHCKTLCAQKDGSRPGERAQGAGEGAGGSILARDVSPRTAPVSMSCDCAMAAERQPCAAQRQACD